MFNSLRTLRFRLALLYLVVFGVIQSALCLGILILREREIWQHFSDSLLEKATLIADGVDTPPVANVPSRLLSSPSFVSYFVQIAQADGTILQRSPHMDAEELPWLGPPTSDRPWSQIVTGPLADTLTEPGGRLFLYGFKHRLPNGEVLLVHIARSMMVLDFNIANLRRIVAGALLLGLFMAGAASLFVARRSLAPIGRIADQAANFAGADLHRRLDAPAGPDEVAQMVHVLNGMLDRLEKAFRAQEHFIADVSHQLQTPLTILLGEAQILAQPGRSHEEYRNFVASVRDELQRLTRIIDSLLMLTRAEGGFPLQGLEPVPVNQVVADAVQQCAAQAALHKVSLVPTLVDGEHGDVYMSGNADLLTTAIVNLIRNAIKYSPPRSFVDIAVQPQIDDMVAIRVCDAGPGIAPEHLPHVFDRFYRAPDEQDTRTGMGLGLAIAKAMVDLHGGRISASNRAQGGCEFVITLPKSKPI